MRQLGEGGKELAVGAGAEAVGLAGAVEAGVRDGVCAEAAVVGAGAGTGVRVGAEEAAGVAAGVEAEEELVLVAEEALVRGCGSEGLLGREDKQEEELHLFSSIFVFISLFICT